MGRNDPCFCGSGKKNKKCHPDVLKSSVVGNLLCVYNQLDQYINEQLKVSQNHTICHKGCCECCYDYFYISEVEYFAILNYLITMNGLDSLEDIRQKALLSIEEIKNCYPDEYEKLIKEYCGSNPKNILDDMRIKKTQAPCIFLNKKDKICTIYPVRPFVCRIYGTCVRSNCDKMKYMSDSDVSIVDIRSYAQMIQENIDVFYFGRIPIERRPYPISYWFSHFLQYFLERRDAKYYCSIGRSISDYKNLILNLHAK